jgi:hypothetical protein
MELKMLKEYSIFLTAKDEELAEILHREFKRRGLLKDVPAEAERELFEGEVSIEYKWSQEI